MLVENSLFTKHGNRPTSLDIAVIYSSILSLMADA